MPTLDTSATVRWSALLRTTESRGNEGRTELASLIVLNTGRVATLGCYKKKKSIYGIIGANSLVKHFLNIVGPLKAMRRALGKERPAGSLPPSCPHASTAYRVAIFNS